MRPLQFLALIMTGLFFWAVIIGMYILAFDRNQECVPSLGMKAETESLADGSESFPAVPPELSVAVETLSGEESPSGSSQASDSPFNRSSPGSSFCPKNEAVKAFFQLHPNNPLRFVPATATQDELNYVELHAQEIVTDWETTNSRLRSQWGDDLLGFSSDPKAAENDRNRQFRLRLLVESLWPGSLPGRKEKP